MIFTELPLAGAFAIDVEPRSDERGLFARTVCAEEFGRHGLSTVFVQSSVSWNRQAGTLRGLHFQAAPHEEEKLVRCTAGRVFDVMVDLRPGSATHGRWTAVELDAGGRRAVYIPGGFAHGFMTLEPDSELLYQMTTPYVPGAARGLAWDDPDVGIVWPAGEKILSDRDRELPGLAGLRDA